MTEADEYEQMSHDIMLKFYEHVLKVYNRVPPVTLSKEWGRKAKVEGASGIKHQIDAWLDDEQSLWLAECKCLDKDASNPHITLEHVLIFLARIIDITPKHPGKVIHTYMVTKHGYTEPAEQLASYYNIELAYVRSADDFAYRYLDPLTGRQTIQETLTGKFGCRASLEETFTPAPKPVEE